MIRIHAMANVIKINEKKSSTHHNAHHNNVKIFMFKERRRNISYLCSQIIDIYITNKIFVVGRFSFGSKYCCNTETRPTTLLMFHQKI